MKLLKLTMQAFGPYADTEEIDFSAISKHHIFVISGKTGAGKTTIFDAISFSLFGKANTSDRDAVGLRSDFAKPGLVSSVTFEFELAGKYYRIMRQPQQRIYKKNSTEQRVANAVATLHQLTETEDILLGSNVRDVDETMYQLLQLNVEQFRRILMIPQNAFRELLVASSKEKQDILQKLAHTLMYEQITQTLKQQQKEQQLSVERLTAELEQIELEFGELEQQDRSVVDKLQHISQEITEKQAYLTKVDEGLAVLEIRIDNATKDVAFAEVKSKDWENLEQTKRTLEQWQKQAGYIQKIKRQLTNYEAVQKVQSIYDICAHREQIVQQTEHDVEQAQREITQLQKTLKQVQDKRELFLTDQVEQNERQKQLQELQTLEAKIAKVASESLALGELQAQLQLQEQERQRVQERLAECERNKVKALQEQQELVQVTHNKNEALIKQELWQQELTQLTQAIEQQILKQKLQQEQQQLQASHQNISITLNKLRQTMQQEQRRTSEELAATLAEHLADGSPCPVCGSTTHPNKAMATNGDHTEQLKELEHNYETLHTRLHEVQAAQARVGGQLEQIGHSIQTLEHLKNQKEDRVADLEQLSERMKQWDSFILQRSHIEDNIAWLNKQMYDLGIQEQAIQQTIAQQQGPAQQKQAFVELLEKEVPRKFMDKQVFEHTLQELTQVTADFEAQQQVIEQQLQEVKQQLAVQDSLYQLGVKQYQEQTGQLQQQQSILHQAMLQEDIESIEQLLSLVLTEEQVETFKADIMTYEQQVYHLQQQQQELQQKLEGQQPPDITVLQTTLQQLVTQKKEQAEKTLIYRSELQKMTYLYERYQHAYEDYCQAEQAYRAIGTLSEVASGKNERNLSFENYVLGAFLDTILLHANARLSKMTAGRFELVRKLEKAKHNAQSGLDIDVFDAYTETIRPVTSLSGGESFQTALALALALAEVVQEMSGGVVLDTMLIDEGFGTLDSESLDMAIDTLLELQQGGRLVGIISHVPELKQRIPARLEVVSTNQGSYTRFSVS